MTFCCAVSYSAAQGVSGPRKQPLETYAMVCTRPPHSAIITWLRNGARLRALFLACKPNANRQPGQPARRQSLLHQDGDFVDGDVCAR